jgi:WD40 repeat protein
LQFWDARSVERIGAPLDHPEIISTAAFSPDSSLIAVGTGHPLEGDGRAVLWKVETREPFGDVLKHSLSVLTVAFAPDGKTLITCCRDGRARQWNVADQRVLREFVSAQAMLAADFSPAGLLAIGGTDQQVRLHDLSRDPTLLHSFAHPHSVMGVAFSRDGRRLLTGCADNRARVWDAGTGQLNSRSGFQHQGWVRGVAISPDGKIALTSGEDKTARLWDIESGLPLGAVMEHGHYVSSVAFSPDGRRVLTGSLDKTACLWDVPQPLPGDPSDIERWITVITGVELDAHGSVCPLDAATWQEYRRQVKDPRE